MPALLNPTARRLDRLDEQTYRVRTLLLDMVAVTNVSAPDVRDRALEECVNGGLLTSPYRTFQRDFDYAMTEVVKSKLPGDNGEVCDGNHHTVSGHQHDQRPTVYHGTPARFASAAQKEVSIAPSARPSMR